MGSQRAPQHHHQEPVLLRRSRAIKVATARTGTKMIRFETSPARMASMRLAEPLGIVLGNITATNTTPKANGRTRPVTAEVLSIVTTRAIIIPMRNRSVSCESTRSIKTAFPWLHAFRIEARWCWSAPAAVKSATGWAWIDGYWDSGPNQYRGRAERYRTSQYPTHTRAERG